MKQKFFLFIEFFEGGINLKSIYVYFARKNHEKDTVDKFGEILEKIQLVSVHLQQNLGELKGQLEKYINNVSIKYMF